MEIGFGGEERGLGRSMWAGHLRRPLLLVAVTLLCGIAYIAGIWYGTRGGFTCTTAQPGVIQCGSDTGSTPSLPQPLQRPAAGSA